MGGPGVPGNFYTRRSKGLLSARWQSDFGRDFERPRNNSRTVRFYYPYENSHRFTASYVLPDFAGFREMAITGFLGTYEQRTDQDRFATATTGRSIERADVAANDFHVKGSAQRLVGRARVEFGVDVNGRYDLEALDIIQALQPRRATSPPIPTTSRSRTRTASTPAPTRRRIGARPALRAAAGLRGDYVTTENVGGFFGDRSTSNGAASGFGSLTVDAAARLQL